MITDLESKEENMFTNILVTNFSALETFINASDDIFLINPEIKSPMGVNLSGFKRFEKASYFKGKKYNWITIKEHLKK